MSSRWSDGFRNALTLRLGLWYAGLFVVSATVLLAITYLLLGRALASQDHEVLASMLSRYASEYQRSGLEGLRSLVEDDESEGRHERVLVRVTGPQAEVVYFAQPPGWGTYDLSRLDDPITQRSEWTTLDGADGSVAEVGRATLPRGIVVQVGRSSHVRDELLSHFRARAVEVGALLAVIAALGGLLIAHVALAPVRAMEATSSAILQTGRFTARVATQGTTDPLDRLGDRINAMLARIEVLLAGMRGALDNVAHDLRTPLARFRNVAESALLKGDDAAAREGLARAVEEADRVAATLRALIDISEAEASAMTLHRETVPLALIVEEAVALHSDEAEDRRIALDSVVDPALTVHVDRARVRQVLANLIENAVKYTPTGGRIVIDAAAPRPEHVEVRVRDTGIGIASEDLPLVWDRLYRADASRSTRGLGLGLSLVKAIVEAHGGHVAVSSTVGQGSTFSVSLPAGWPGSVTTSPPPADARPTPVRS
jgi:signal transduction histidine kinase